MILQKFNPKWGRNVLNSLDIHALLNGTSVRNVRLAIAIRKGEGKIVLDHVSDTSEKTLFRTSFDGASIFYSPNLQISSLKSGFIIPKIITEDENEEIDISMHFETSDPITENKKVNFVICTFGRPEFTYRNSKVIRDFFKNNPEKKDLAHFTIVDNKGDAKVMRSKKISILQNNNSGGAGGFGRGIYETVYGKLSNSKFTDVCLMDDDLLLCEEMIERTITFIQYKKANIHLGAGMIELPSSDKSATVDEIISRKPNVHTYGHLYSDGVASSHPRVAPDINIYDFIKLSTMQPKKATTTGWWWHAFSVEAVKKAGLAYPFFVKMDDVEYNLRLQKFGYNLIIPKNFFVIHEDFRSKYTVFLEYFKRRNKLVLLANRAKPISKKEIFKHYFLHSFKNILLKKYELATLTIKAFNDFIKGPEHVSQNYKNYLSEVNQEIKDEKYQDLSNTKILSEENILDNTPYEPVNFFTKALFFLTGGYIFWKIPLREQLVDNTKNITNYDVLRSSFITYFDPKTKYGMRVKSNRSKALKTFFLTLSSLWKILVIHRVASKYRATYVEYTQQPFWDKFTKLTEKRSKSIKDYISKETLESDNANFNNSTTEHTVKDESLLLDSDSILINPTFSARPQDLAILNMLRNIGKGKRCFVIANGPSLKTDDLEKIKNEVSFACNKIFLGFDETSWRPTYYYVEDPLVAESISHIVPNLSGFTKIFPSHMEDYFGGQEDIFYTHWLTPKNNLSKKRAFSADILRGICWGSTATYSLIQLATQMGFSEINILGLDHSYQIPKKKLSGGKLVNSGEVNHFHPGYRNKGEVWNPPVLDKLTISYEAAEAATKKIGVKVYNCSRFTMCDAFERRDFDKIEF